MANLIELNKIFQIKYGINLELVNLEEAESLQHNSIPFVSRTEKNNGVSAYVYKRIDIIPNKGGTLSVAGGGSVLSCFYQPIDYYSGRDIYILTPRSEMSIPELLFYSRCISENKYKYSYGRQANKTLPYLLVPDRPEKSFLTKLNNFYDKAKLDFKKNPIYQRTINIKSTNWKPFELKDLFLLKGTKTTPINLLSEYGNGKYPYITTKASENGCEGFFDNYTENGNVLTIDSAVLGYCSFQALNFSASDHVEKLIPRFEMNKYIALFLVTIINKEQYRFNYGRKASQQRLKNLKIFLPSKNGLPDFEFMEEYIKSLNYSASI